VGPATANSSPSPSGCETAWRLIAVYALSVLAIAGLLALVASAFVPLPLWKIFRRCVSIAAAVSLWLIVRRRPGRSLRAFGFTASPHHLALGIGLGLGSVALVIAAGFALGCYTVQVTPDLWRLWRVAALFLPAALLIGVLEELVFRGLLLQTLLACSRTTAVLVSSLAYSLVHVRTTGMSQLVAMELGGLFLLGVVLSSTYLKTGQLYLAVGMHAALAYAARVNKLVMHIDPELWWLGGTNRLINGLLGWGAVLLLGVLIWRWPAPSERGGVSHAG